MKINYTLSAIMTMGHKIASSIRNTYNQYKNALSAGLKKAWKIAKLSQEWNEITECPQVAHEDIQENWAQRCLGNVGNEQCELTA
tara:strand:- start:650 stop:904 length:255 start_codon:yes stop_codon:yes gene_type:complete